MLLVLGGDEPSSPDWSGCLSGGGGPVWLDHVQPGDSEGDPGPALVQPGWTGGAVEGGFPSGTLTLEFPR